MKHTCFLVVYLFFFQFINAQDEFEFFGALKLNDSSLITYKVIFTEINGKINGYSITDLGGNHETKSEIIGIYNKDENRLYFHEKGIVYTKSQITQDDFCFIHFESKKFKLGKSKKLNGSFKGKYDNNVKCVDGEITMLVFEKITKITKKLTKKINNLKRVPDSVKKKVNPLKLMDTLNMNILRKKQRLSVFTTSKKVDLIIFDGGKEDGDRVKILINDNVILNDFVIKNKRNFIPILIDRNKINIKIIALTNGTIAPNTMSIILKENNREISVLSNLKKGESAEIEILKKSFN